MTNPFNIIFDNFGTWLLDYRIEFSCLYLPHGHIFISTLWLWRTDEYLKAYAQCRGFLSDGSWTCCCCWICYIVLMFAFCFKCWRYWTLICWALLLLLVVLLSYLMIMLLLLLVVLSFLWLCCCWQTEWKTFL